jgi:hypothetical protein
VSRVEPGPGHDPRLEAAGADHPGVAPGPTDLQQVARTRVGLQVAAPGFLLVLLGVIPLAVEGPLPGGLVLATRALGWTLLAAALAIAAPTPNGPLPQWLKGPYVLACLGGALRVAYHRLWFDPAWAGWEERFVQLLWVAFLALPWILWRFCQHRGLTGRAITWLWCAMALLGVFVVNWTTRTSWALWLCPAIGVILFLNARLAARDVWDDAVYEHARPAAAGPA